MARTSREQPPFVAQPAHFEFGTGDPDCSEVHVCSDRPDPDGTAVAVVSRVNNVLDIDCVEQPAPRMPRVVALDDIFAAIVEFAVAEQKAEAPIFQIILMVALDGVGDNGEAYFVQRAMPAGSGVVSARKDGLLHFCVRECIGSV